MVIMASHSWLERNWDLLTGNSYQPPKTIILFNKLRSVKQHTKVRQEKTSHVAKSEGFFHVFFPKKQSS